MVLKCLTSEVVGPETLPGAEPMALKPRKLPCLV